MSLLAKAREGGPAYIASLVTGYADVPADLKKQFPDFNVPPGLHYNPYFANLNIAMPPPLVSDGQVTYADGTKATRLQMATDVSAFLMWAAEPKLENRKRTGYRGGRLSDHRDAAGVRGVPQHLARPEALRDGLKPSFKPVRPEQG